MYRCVLILIFTILFPLGIASAVPVPSPDSSDDAWALLRARTPPERQVYRPTWLPTRFTQPVSAMPRLGGLIFGAGYTSDEGDRLFLAQFGNSFPPETSPETTIVRGQPAVLLFSPKEVWLTWQEGDQSHSIRAFATSRTSAVSREEIVRIAASLVPVGPDGRAQSPAGPPAHECFDVTGQCIGGRFLDRWRATGGAAINGYPLSGEFRQRLDDGNEYTVQYFERVRLEYHPKNPAPYDILLGQFGRHVHAVDPPTAIDPNAYRFFPETGHNLSGRFGNYWEDFGGTAQFGLPISEEVTERLADGKDYRVQYFERARFEYHPENEQPYMILLGQFGRQMLGSDGR